MAENIEALCFKAEKLIGDSRYLEAIELLRSKEAPNNQKLCALLAKAYHLRGDSRGDVYSSHFFAKRAIELGERLPLVFAICGIAAFKKELFAEAAHSFAAHITPNSNASGQYLLGLSLFEAGEINEALPWLERAAQLEPDNQTYTETLIEARSDLKQAQKELKERWQQEQKPNLNGLHHRRPLNVPTPRPTNALSLLRGKSSNPKDLDWLSRNVPCQKGCPAGTNIPEYLSAIFNQNYEQAYRINLIDNVFPGVLGRVCARPCESHCRHGWAGLGESVAICFSKRAAADLREQELMHLKPWFPETGKMVAVVGSGVSGLAAARTLALFGHSVTVYEKHHSPGGMMNQGIPEFRLPRAVIDREIDQVRLQGVKIICSTEVGKDITLKQLRKEYDAVVLAAGTLRPNILRLPGSHLDGIRHGLDFLLEANEFRSVKLGKNIVVIGGGFTAMDCARTALRLGDSPNVQVFYRRSQTEMLITPGELDELRHEGIPMHFMLSPVEYLGKNGEVSAIRFIRNQLGEPDASGRRRPVEIPGSDFEVPADNVLLATGQFPETDWIDEEIKPDLVAQDGWLRSGRDSKTQAAGIFAAGDFACGASSLIEAIGHAKRCAADVDYYLTGEKRILPTVLIEDATTTGRIREMDYVPLTKMPALDLEHRGVSDEVELGYDQSLATEETQRCYLCNFKFEIDPDVCIYCDWCIKAKPRPNCIVKISSLKYDNEGRITGYQEAASTEECLQIWINQEDCIRCNACVDACPVDAISVQKVISSAV